MITFKPKRPHFLFQFLAKTSGKPQQQSGFTLLESIMAIAVVGILLVGSAPMIILSVATRVQARRVDLATQAARSYIDGVRAGVIQIPAKLTDVNTTFTVVQLGAVAAPSNISNDEGVQIDTNGNGFSTSDPTDLVIQPIRNGLAATTTAEKEIAFKQGFDLVVRVYRADAFHSTSPFVLATSASDTAGARLATGNTFSGTASKYKPLVVSSSDSTNPKSTNPTSFDDYVLRIQPE